MTPTKIRNEKLAAKIIKNLERRHIKRQVIVNSFLCLDRGYLAHILPSYIIEADDDV